MNETNINSTDLDTETMVDPDKEPATRHDVAEGGIIGAVGGAIVGGLAGGPIGAVIGAIAGGAASAAAVDVVDKRDHDYNRTVADDTTAPMYTTDPAILGDTTVGTTEIDPYVSPTAKIYPNTMIAPDVDAADVGETDDVPVRTTTPL